MATITPTDNGDEVRPVVLWETIGNGDTCTEKWLAGGEYTVEVTGNFSGSATIQMQWGTDSSVMTAYDTDAAPDGGLFSAAGVSNILLGSGYHKPVVSSGDGSTDIDVKIKPVGK